MGLNGSHCLKLLILFLVSLTFFTENEAANSNIRTTKGNDDEVEKVSCAKPLRKKTRRPATTGIDDITDEMIEIHKEFTDAHGLDQFVANNDMRRSEEPIEWLQSTVYYSFHVISASRNWCEVQTKAGCDLVYPLGVALNVAVIPGFMKLDDVVQLWYNERSSYDPTKSIIENVQRGYNRGYEVRTILVIVHTDAWTTKSR